MGVNKVRHTVHMYSKVTVFDQKRRVRGKSSNPYLLALETYCRVSHSAVPVRGVLSLRTGVDHNQAVLCLRCHRLLVNEAIGGYF